jgi:hypothetical protein
MGLNEPVVDFLVKSNRTVWDEQYYFVTIVVLSLFVKGETKLFLSITIKAKLVILLFSLWQLFIALEAEIISRVNLMMDRCFITRSKEFEAVTLWILKKIFTFSFCSLKLLNNYWLYYCSCSSFFVILSN